MSTKLGGVPTAHPRSTRDRPAKPPLSEELIVDTALAILRAEGLDAVTMRRVATELDTGPASLYVYIAGRDELRIAMLDRVAGAVPLQAPDPGRWRDQVHALMRGVLDVMEAHPGIATVAVANPPTSERTLLFADNLMGVLLAGGVSVQDAAWACDILPLIATATAVETAAYESRGGGPELEAEVIAQLAATFAALPPERFPHLAAHHRAMTAGSGAERFRYSIDVFLDGLEARAARG